jgi:hypothetical protein
MGRIRTIKPDFFRHEGLFEAERSTALPLRVAFAGLWTVADREGRFRWRPRQLKLDVLPFDDLDFERVLNALITGGFIVRYESEGEAYCWIPKWAKHQVINNRELASNLPAPPEWPAAATPNGAETSTRAARAKDANCTRKPRDAHATGTPLVQEPGEREGEREEEGEVSVASQPRPRRKAGDQAKRVPPCPYSQVVEIYHDLLPELPGVKVMDKGREKAIKNLWDYCLTTPKKDGQPRATNAAEALTWIRAFFERARENDWVMNRAPRGPGHENWKADIEYVCGPKGLKRVLEKTEAAV